MGAIVAGIVQVGGLHAVEPFFGTVGGISVAGDADSPAIGAYAVYFTVALLFLGLALAVGRRGGCHIICWMAPFMIVGWRLRNLLGAWPALRLAAERPACIECGACTRECPMSIDVQNLVASGSMEHDECVHCGTCVDRCPKSVIRFTFAGGSRVRYPRAATCAAPATADRRAPLTDTAFAHVSRACSGCRVRGRCFCAYLHCTLGMNLPTSTGFSTRKA